MDSIGKPTTHHWERSLDRNIWFQVVSTYRDYDMSPAGERLLMVFPADQADSGEPARPQINIVLNWFEELKERVPVP